MDRHLASTNRACESCKRKKTKCDGVKPSCSLCSRIRSSCVYPQRKSRARDRLRSVSTISDDVNAVSFEGDSMYHVADSTHNNVNINHILGERETGFHGQDMGWEGYPNEFHDPGEPARSEMALHPSPTEQDMLDFLTQTIPDIWNAENLSRHERERATMPAVIQEAMDPVSAEAGAMRALNHDIHESTQKQDTPPTSSRHGSLADGGYESEAGCMDIPSALIGELLELYFQRVQAFLPLFNRPSFFQKYFNGHSENRYTGLSDDQKFLLYGMMALSARFSSSWYFAETSPKERGSRFAKVARKIYFNMVQDESPQTPSIVWLQGSILLAYYNQSCRPALGCDLTVATCIRLTYDLGLHRIDEEALGRESPDLWVDKEEQRRAWWCVWELDAFDSITSRRPFTINWTRVCVLLPVSDEAWFSNTPIKSAMLSLDPLQSWRALRDSPNQDERAWFLISNFILAQALELCQQRHVPPKSINDLESAVSCFSLLFHDKFRGSIDNLTFNEKTYSKSNYIILTRLMVQSARIATHIMNSRSSTDPILTPSNRFAEKPAVSTQSAHKLSSSSLPRIESYHQFASEIFRIYQSWPPDFIGFAPPTMVSVITGPAAIMLRFARYMRKEQNHNNLSEPSIQEDLLVLILKHFAHYWNIGLFLLDFVKAFRES